MTGTDNEDLATRCAAFRERFALARFDDGGVLLDLERGDFFVLNRSAARLCASMLCGAAVPPPDVRSVLAQVDVPSADTTGLPLDFTCEGPGYRMSWNGEPVLWLAEDGQTLRRAGGRIPRDLTARLCLLFAARHALLLRRQPLLHASSVSVDGRALVFLGESGAGKTTVARALSMAGCPLVSEDLGLLALRGDEILLLRGAESHVEHWARERGEEFAASDQAAFQCVALPNADECSPLPVAELYFLALPRACGDRPSVRSLAAPDALGWLLQTGFGAVRRGNLWRGLLETGARVVGATPCKRLCLPQGLAAVHEAARRYSSNRTW